MYVINKGLTYDTCSQSKPLSPCGAHLKRFYFPRQHRLHKPRLFTHRSLQRPLHRHPSTATSNFSSTTSLQFLIDKQKKQHCATMSSRLMPSALRACSRPTFQPQQFARNFRTSPPSLETSSAALPLRKPVGAFRGGYVPRLLVSCMTASLLRVLTNPCSVSLYRLFGFLLGTTLAGAGTYYYILDEYRVSNELLTEDIYVRDLYERVCI